MEFSATTAAMKKKAWLVKPYIRSSDQGHVVRIAPFRGAFVGHIAWPMTPTEIEDVVGVPFYKAYFGDELYSKELPRRTEAEGLLSKIKEIFAKGYEAEEGETDPSRRGTLLDLSEGIDSIVGQIVNATK